MPKKECDQREKESFQQSWKNWLLLSVVESPSRINELRPSSCGKEIALTTPKPAIPNSGNIAPSKLILREPLGGGDHWIWELVWSTCRADQGRSILKSERDCDAWGITWEIRNSFRPTLSWFLWYHNVLMIIAIRLWFFPSTCMKRTRSLNDGKERSWWNAKSGMQSQTSTSFRHSHNAWQMVSGDSL